MVCGGGKSRLCSFRRPPPSPLEIATFKAMKCWRWTLILSLATSEERGGGSAARVSAVITYRLCWPQSWQWRKIYCGDGWKTKNSCANFTELHYGKCLFHFPLVNVLDAVSKRDWASLPDWVQTLYSGAAHWAERAWPEVPRPWLTAKHCCLGA